MCRPAIGVYLAALLLAGSGCSAESFLLSATGPGGKQQVVAGSVDQVSAHLQAMLGPLGINLTSSREGTAVRLSGITRSGKKFALRLKQQDSPAGQRTAVTIQWDGETDETFWNGLVELLLLPLPPPPPPGGR